MPWIGQRKPWSNLLWDGQNYVEGSRPKPKQRQLPIEAKLSVWQKIKRFFKSLF